jgi:hypothetical protein
MLFNFFRREIQTLQQENYSLEKQLHTATIQQHATQGNLGPVTTGIGSGSSGGAAGIAAMQPGGAGAASAIGAPYGGSSGVGVGASAVSGPRTKSFDNPSASSTASSGVGTSISSINTTNSTINVSAPSTPSVVKKYYDQKYGSTINMSGNVGAVGGGGGGVGGTGMMASGYQNKMNMNPASNGMPRTGAGMFHPPNVMGGSGSGSNSPANSGSGLSSLTSQFTNSFANLKLSASNFQTNKLTSKLMNPFSS